MGSQDWQKEERNNNRELGLESCFMFELFCYIKLQVCICHVARRACRYRGTGALLQASAVGCIVSSVVAT